MKMKNMRKSILFLLCAVVLLTGCGGESNGESGKSIELKEPVSVAVNSEKAMIRSIREYKIYNGFVYPKTEEYGFGDSVTVAGTFAYPGDEVTEGTVLASSDISSMQEKLNIAKEKLDAYVEEYENYVASQKVVLEELIDKRTKVAGSSVEAQIITQKIESLEREMEEKERLYTLDYEYGQTYLNQMSEMMTMNSVVSGMDGVVVAVGGVKEGRYNSGPYISSYQTDWGDSVIAVADTADLHIRCDYMAKNVVNKAKDIYALIDGKRVEIIYESMTTDEYNELKDKNGEVFTTYHFAEEPVGVSVGDFVCIIVINDSNENVVSVSNSCIRKDETGNFVYVMKDGKMVYTPVKTGLSDSMYTAILSGLSEGDEVLGATKLEHRQDTITVTKSDFKTEYTGEGTVLYPKKVSVVSEIVYGEVQFEGTKVSLFQKVKKGDILASVRVKVDEVEMQTQKTQLERLEQRYADFVAAGTSGKEIELAKKEKELQQQRDLVAKMEKDSVTTQIVAPTDGIVVSLTQYFQGGKLTEGTEVAQIADPSGCYIMAENKNQQLSLGMEVEIFYKTAMNKDAQITGTVVSVSEMGISRELCSDYAFVQIPEEGVTELADGIMNNWGRFEIKADIREMKDVIVIPKTAVSEVNGTAFVHILNADGSVTTQSIVAGGYNNEYYWVAAGLTEGMELCLR